MHHEHQRIAGPVIPGEAPLPQQEDGEHGAEHGHQVEEGRRPVGADEFQAPVEAEIGDERRDRLT